MHSRTLRERFRGNLFKTVQLKILWISFWRASWSILLRIGRTIVWSSANWKSGEETTSFKSLTKSKKKIGPRTEPWGTPDVTEHHFETAPLNTTRCFRSKRKFWIHWRRDPIWWSSVDCLVGRFHFVMCTITTGYHPQNSIKFIIFKMIRSGMGKAQY